MKLVGFENIAVVIAAPPVIPGVRVTNWGESDAISIKRRENSASDKVSVDGHMTVFVNSNKSGEIELTVMQTSPINKVLGAIVRLQEGGPDSFVPTSISFVDTRRQDTMKGLFGYVQKPADVERGNEAKEQKWTIIVEKLDMLFGDPSFAAFASAAAEGQG